MAEVMHAGTENPEFVDVLCDIDIKSRALARVRGSVDAA